MMMVHQQRKSLAFVADGTLGKLARHLRLVGFDTLLDIGKPDAGRLAGLSCGHRTILTRSTRVKKALGIKRVILIHDDRPAAQISQVIIFLDVKREDLRPMTRCALCNRILDPLTKDQARGRVPDYVWQQHTQYNECSCCKRVYWRGTHADRWMKRLEAWF
jgi:uncharacterized protein with PIN domain